MPLRIALETALLANTTWPALHGRFRANMTAFLKIDTCNACHRSLPWEWAPAVLLNGRPLAGTGVWRSQLVDHLCPTCLAAEEARRLKDARSLAVRKDLVSLLGGEKPYRQFTVERYRVTPENQLAFERAKRFDPGTENLYLWGSCGVGKTHLAYAIARRCFDETLSVVILRAGQLSRRVRRKDPEQEQAAIDELIQAETLVVDDLGAGNITDYGRQILQEILDGRDFTDRAGLVVTSKYSLDTLAERMNDDAISSRLAGLASIIEIRGPDGRVRGRSEANEAPPRLVI